MEGANLFWPTLVKGMHSGLQCKRAEDRAARAGKITANCCELLGRMCCPQLVPPTLKNSPTSSPVANGQKGLCAAESFLIYSLTSDNLFSIHE